MNAQARPGSHLRGWLASVGLGMLAGCCVGFGATGDYTHIQWPVLAGFALGVLSALLDPTRRVRIASCGVAVAVVAAVATMAAVHYHSGFWPITDEFRTAHFGSTAKAILRGAVIYGGLIGVPCLLAALCVGGRFRRRPGI